MEYLQFIEEQNQQYNLNGSLLSHSRISPGHRARLFNWLSEECAKQKFSRHAYALTCSYLDLYFMKRNDILLKDYQILALGALALASKQVQIEGKLPKIDIELFPLDQILKMQNNIVTGLNFYLNPPNYVEKLNNIAKLWDIKCESGDINSVLRYFTQNRESYLRLKAIYQKMDCLHLFKKILDFELQDFVVTMFFTQTKIFSLQRELQGAQPQTEILFWKQKQQEKDQFQRMFEIFLNVCQIKCRPIAKLQRIMFMLTRDNYPISQEIRVAGRTFTHVANIQTHNPHCFRFYERHKEAIQKA